MRKSPATTIECNPIVVDAAIGTLVTTFGDNGKVDLYEGLGRDVHFIWITAAFPEIIYKDLLIMGSTLGEGPSPAVPGHIRAYDVRTGEIRWISSFQQEG